MRLLSVKPSVLASKKLTAVFDLGGGRRITRHFGAAGYDDFTTYSKRDRAHADRRRRLYIARHARENQTDPTTPAALSRYILWNKRTLRESIADFKRRFRV